MVSSRNEERPELRVVGREDRAPDVLSGNSVAELNVAYREAGREFLATMQHWLRLLGELGDNPTAVARFQRYMAEQSDKLQAQQEALLGVRAANLLLRDHARGK